MQVFDIVEGYRVDRQVEGNDGNLFWRYQLLGWGAFGLLLGLLHSFNGGLGADDVAYIAAQLFSGVLLTWLLRFLYRSCARQTWPPIALLGVALLSCLALMLLAGSLEYLLLAFTPWAVVWRPDGQLLVAALLWSLAYFVVGAELSRRRQQAMQLALERQRLDTLLAQLEPHFLFNAINNIRALILEDPATARTLLGEFSALLRYVMHEHRDTVPMADELAMADKYLALQALQFEDRLEVTKTLEPALSQLELPRMALQLLLENAVKHGISQNPQGGRIELLARVEGDRALIEVSNSGELAPKPAECSGLGLENLRQRLALQYGNRARLTLSATEGMVKAQIAIEGGAIQC
ncbi:sensor histidine kinase [Shewanella sedimentimangrovi]|uniref:Histidine kinase n=1 Tax=Shewanella sedimentimangrovi TaxID=2814293 RepID=A0ABX7R3A3_9GAMM|nr:histidine kinase [Shewanella sedimentimangrovi]QSX38268.1 histidine kinase [Shewanella sedimentimangrovi]